MIVIINGPLGIGKTETAWALLDLFNRAVMLDGDYIGAVRPFAIYDAQRLSDLFDTLHLLVDHYQKKGYPHVIINYIFETPAQLAELRKRLAELEPRILAYRLTCGLDLLEQRIRGRTSPGVRQEWEIARAHQLTDILETNARLGDLGLMVDTTCLDVSQAAQAIWDLIHEEVHLSPYQPRWAEEFADEQAKIAAHLGELAVEIQHIGSTAVPGLSAKPILDILIAVPRMTDSVACIAPLRELGYEVVDHPDQPDRLFFRKGHPRSHHLHIVEFGSPTYADHIDFRDALRGDPTLSEAYQALKEDLAVRYRQQRFQYTLQKTDFISQALADWRAEK